MRIKELKKNNAKRVISILLAALIVFTMIFPEGGIEVQALPGFSESVPGDYLTSKINKYLILKQKAEELSNNINALMGVADISTLTVPNALNDLNECKERMNTLVTQLEEAVRSVRDYYTEQSDVFPFSFTSDQVVSTICSLSDKFGDPSGCRRDYEVYVAQLGAALSDAETAINGKDFILAGRALLEYADAIETMGKNVDASGMTGVESDVNEYNEHFSNSSDYESFSEDDITDADSCFKNLCGYYEWLIGYFKVIDYRDYLFDRQSVKTTEENETQSAILTEERAILKKIDDYTFRDFPKVEKIVREGLLPLLSLVPEKYDPASAASGGAINIKLNKYAGLEAEISAVLLNVEALKATEENKENTNSETVGKLEQTIAGLTSLSGEIRSAVRGFTGYYSGETTDLGFSVSEADVPLRMLSYTENDSAYNKGINAYKGAAGTANFTVERGGEALLSGDCTETMQAFFAYADFIEKMSDLTSGVVRGFKNAINAYDADYSVSSEYQSYDDEQTESAADTFSVIGRYYRWLFDRYVLFDYRDYLSDPGVTVSGKEAVIEKIDYYTFAYYDEARAFIREGLIPRFYMLSDAYKYCGRASAVFGTLQTSLLYNGNDQTLLSNAGTAEGGTLLYALGDNSSSVPSESSFSLVIPKGKEPGTYYVWYKVKADPYYSDSVSQYIEVRISKIPVNLSLSQADWVKGDEGDLPQLTGNAGNGAVSYAYKKRSDDDNAYVDVVPTEPGNYIVRATVAETAHYLGGTATAEFTITEPEPTPGPSSGTGTEPTPGTGTEPTPGPSPAPVIDYQPDYYPEEPKPAEKKDGGLTTTTEVKNPNGTISCVSVIKYKDNITATRETVKDEDGKFLEYKYEYAESKKNGTKLVQTYSEKADGSRSEAIITTTKSGTVTSKIKELTSEGTVISKEEKKYASGKSSLKEVITDADGTIKVVTEDTGASGTHSRAEYTMIASDDGKVVKLSLTKAEVTGKSFKVPDEIRINGQRFVVTEFGDGAFKGVGNKKRVTISVKAETEEEFEKICDMIRAAGAGKKVRFAIN